MGLREVWKERKGKKYYLLGKIKRRKKPIYASIGATTPPSSFIISCDSRQIG
jgi:hypothetical protein